MKRAIIIALVILIVIGIGLYFPIVRMASPGAIKLREYTNLSLISKDKLQIEDFQIGGIKLEQSILDIQKSTFGKPIKKYRDRQNEFETYEYSGLKIEFNIITKHIVWISSERKDLKTFRGISVGDKEEEVLYRYGQKEKLEGTDLNYQKYVSRNDLDYNYAINFTIKDGKVKQILVYFATD